MRLIDFLACILLALLIPSTAQASDLSLSGSINGKLKIQMSLKIEDGNVSGTYFYESKKKDIPVKGMIGKDGELNLSEFDPAGNVTGVFKAILAPDKKQLQGTWSTPDGSKSFPFVAEAKSDSATSTPKQTDELTKLGVFQNQGQEKDFAELAGDDYEKFLDTFHLVSEGTDLDELDATVHTGAVRGLFTVMEGIIMYDGKGKYLAAVIDGDVVRFFANDTAYARELPKTIEKWREGFSDKEVVFMPSKSGPETSTKATWTEGEWSRVGAGRFEGAGFTITKATTEGFTFEMSAASGANSGQIDGEAKISGAEAVYLDADSKCKVTFTKKNSQVVIETSDECSSFGGVGVTFDGEYQPKK